MLRENLVGVLIVETDNPILLVDFLGEGAEGVVYEFAPLSDLAKRDQAIKLPKQLVLFEMETLHHGLRVHEELYPDHPLRMSAQKRLEMLTNEMLAKIDYGHFIFRVALYRQILDDTFVVLEKLCSDTFRRGESLAPVLDASPVLEWLDDNLVRRLEELLDDDLIFEQHRPLFEAVLTGVESGIARWQEAGSYFPLSRNPFFNLIGLHAEDFINHDELVHISRSPNFVARIVPRHVAGLFDLIATLYFHLKGRLERGQRVMVENRRSGVDIAVAACGLLEHVGTEWFVGLARLWKARLLLLEEAPFDVVEPPAHIHLTHHATDPQRQSLR